MCQGYAKQFRRFYLLHKYRGLMEDVMAIHKAARSMAPEEARAARLRAAPAYLKSRVERGEALPLVSMTPDMRKRGSIQSWVAFNEQPIKQVIEHVVLGSLPKDLYLELLDMMWTDDPSDER